MTAATERHPAAPNTDIAREGQQGTDIAREGQQGMPEEGTT